MADNSTNTGWQGYRRPTSEVQHRWASGASDSPARVKPVPVGFPGWRMGLLLLAALITTGVLVYSLSYYPRKTPLITICLQDYAWPVPPNAGVAEDLNGLLLLDGLNIKVQDISSRWKNQQAGLYRLEECIEELSAAGHKQGPLMVYLNGHGVVDETGEPCLLLPGYDPAVQNQWLPMRDLIEKIQVQVSGSRDVILIVDCVKMRSHWRLGILANLWQERMRFLVNDIGSDRLKVLSATGSYQVNEFSRELNATVFGHYLRLGLAGFADGVSESTGSGRVRRDGTVSILELTAYVRQQVSRWAQHNRGDVQLPELLTAGNRDVSLVTGLNRTGQATVRTAKRAAPGQSLSLDDLALVWGKLDRLRSDEAVRNDPQKIHYLENQLYHLEQLWSAGQGYAATTARQFENLDAELDRLLENPQAFGPKFTSVHRAGPLGTLRANELLGVLTPDETERFTQQFIRDAEEVDQESILLVGETDNKPQRLESFVAGWLNRLNRSGIWPTTSLSSRMANLHLRSEQAGLPTDIRSHFWSVAELNEADQVRRQAFDLLFTGESSAEESLEKAEQLLTRILEDENSAQQGARLGFAARDRAAANYLSLAAWHTRWHSPLADVDPATRQTALDEKKQMLVDLADRLRTLATGLTPVQAGEARDLSDVNETRRQLNRLLDRLQVEFAEHCQKLENVATRDGVLVFELQSTLKSTLIPAPQRKELLKKLREVQLELAESFEASTEERGLAIDDLEACLDHLTGEAESQENQVRHPLLAFLDLEPETGRGESIDHRFRIGGRISRRIQEYCDRDRLLELSANSDLATELTGIQRKRVALQTGEFLQRQTLPLVDSSRLDFDLVDELQRFEMQQTLIWQARRSLIDFHGRLAGTSANGLDEPFVFESLTQSFLARAESLYPETWGMDETVLQLITELSRLVEVADQAVAMSVESEVQLGDERDTELNVRLASPADPATASHLAVTGKIAFHLQSPDEPIWGPGFSMNYPLAEDGVVKSWQVESPRNSRLVAFFRGHQFQTSVLIRSLDGHRVVVVPDTPSQSEVTLIGDQAGPSSVMFILDCSQSMAEEIRTELIGEATVPRLKLAKGVLATMLNELASRRGTRVGVRFFGHRSGWSTSEPSVRLRQESYTGKFPDLLVPESDVELALPVGRFTEQEAAEIKSKMESIKPWGQSPLHLALLQALNDFEREEEGTQKSIVVITDGVNYQFSPENSAVDNPRITSLDEVISRLESRPIPVFILGFGISAEEKAEADASFYSIASQSGGKYFPVESGKQLLETLRDQLKLGGYQVVRDDQAAAASPDNALTRLYETVKLAAPGDYRLAAQSAELPFTVEGGEKLQFRLTDTPLIVSLPFEEGMVASTGMIHPRQAGRLIVRAHRPQRSNDAVDFLLSLQFANRPFTPRPWDLWVEIRPVLPPDRLPGQPLPTFVFFDRQFESGTPVPVLKCPVTNWPPESQAAEVRVWCKDERTRPGQIKPLSDWTGRRTAARDAQPVEGFPGLRYRVETVAGDGSPNMIRIMEEHTADSDGVYSVRIDLKTDDSLQPIRIVRQFDAESRLAVHSYYFESATIQQVIESEDSMIHFTARQAIQNDAWTSERPLNFRIFSEPELLPLNSATGVR